MRYKITNSTGQPLSAFYLGEVSCGTGLKYRKNNYMSFNTKDEAAKHIAYIQRYGIGRNLKISPIAKTA